MKRRAAMVWLSAIGLTTTSLTRAQGAFPQKPLTLICPWSAGGGTDLILRALAKEAEAVFGQTVTVVNTTGGGGAVGHNAILRARPDGYTVGMITFELNSLPPQGLVPFTHKDFDPLMRVNVDPPALTVHKDAPYNNLKEFIAYAKSHPGEITIGNSGPGSVWHIAAGLMAERAGLQVKHVPFDGAAPAVTSLVGGHIKAVSVSVAEVQSQVKAGQLKLLGVMDTRRAALFPDVPTFAEQGTNVSFGTWRGLALPKGVPADAKRALEAGFHKAFESAGFKAMAQKTGLGLAYLPPAEFAGFLDANARDVAAVMKTLGLVRG